MPVNNGVISVAAIGGDVVARFCYDNSGPASSDQPLVDGPRGYCLDMTNISGRVADITITMPDESVQTIRIGKGDPVTGGPPAGRSRTAAQLAQFGLFTRGDVRFNLAT